ncbi:WGR domain-containing protein [Rhizobium bangladeshense]|uniref:WGR domain-containing protein n=1 Tax=Rhizobium bangladeshense TaxID=1138189 RepID=UPI001C835669|nr:WGR domain-containing protein [Rhizobium bangladeshense]MBX4911388.1 WGR domain-containing protein [Rhizobium bangladeshense]
MSYPIDFAQIALVYSDGNRSNKFYNATLLVAPTGMAILIRRWGKAGAPGEMKIERFAIQKKAETEFEKLVQSKIGKGYETKSNDIKQIADESSLRVTLGPAVWPRIPGPDLQHILPSMDVTGRPKELNAPRFSEEGKYLGEPAPRVYSQAEIRAAREAEKAAEQAEAVKTYSSNPHFGRF